MQSARAGRGWLSRPYSQLSYPAPSTRWCRPKTPGTALEIYESQFRHLMRVAVSVREGVISSTTLLKKPRSGSHKNATYVVFREVGRVIRTVGPWTGAVHHPAGGRFSG
ncbi:Transposase, TnpA family [Streptomyces chartreusis NRRL 3882]|uniref:Transposase, TnpA family n=1 Tax=Streptomyces chartreusis NRRL 3882 TaxID=1079985 RepID=A0A2N9BLY1_STRCX|nr:MULTISPECIES: Tn3 family transposase [Streptomyces]SOR84373.1 Transposase, TnpA family [Streptomyces chartreusis NRRL 3882]